MSANNELEDMLARQHGIQQNLINLERQIYEYEGSYVLIPGVNVHYDPSAPHNSYLDDTQNLGNIFRGFEGFLSVQNPAEKRPVRKFKDSERLFSLSSCTSARANDVRPAPGSPVQSEERKKGSMYKRKPASAVGKVGRDSSSKKAKARTRDTDEEVDIA